MENKIPTAEEIYIQYYGVCPMIEKEIALHSHKDMIKFAKEFAKLHVEAALKEATKKSYYAHQDLILNSYPLNNIK